MSEEKFDTWGVVEVMGHSRYAGRITEQAIGGCSFVRVDVPETKRNPAFTKLLGQGSIFAITPTDEAIARGVAEGCYEPLAVLRLPAPVIGTDERPVVHAGGADDSDVPFDDDELEEWQ